MTPEEQHEAQKLGFNPPTPQVEMPKMTSIVGFFNPNPWPVQVSLSEFSLCFTLQNRGEYIVDAKGRKINDPIFERFCVPNGLAREMADSPVPVLGLVQRKLVAPLAHGFDGTMNVARNEKGENAPVWTAAKTEMAVPLSRSPVAGMSRQQAEKLGLIKPTMPVQEDAGVAEGNITRGGIPDIPLARDITPQHAARLGMAVPPAPAIPSSALVENAEQAQTVKALEAAANTDPDSPDILANVLNANPNLTMVANTPSQLPSQAVREIVPEVKERLYVCNVDGKNFPNRAELERYAKRKYPDIVNQIMEPYPRRRPGPPPKAVAAPVSEMNLPPPNLNG